MRKLKDWTPEALANFAAGRGVTVEEARAQLADIERFTFASPYTGNRVSHGSQYGYDRAKGKHDAIVRLEATFPELFAAVGAGNAPVVRFQCPEGHHLAKVHIVVAGSADHPDWQLHALDTVVPMDDAGPEAFNGDGGRECVWQDEPGGELCGEPFAVEKFGQRTCPRHGSEVWTVPAMLSRGSFLCEKCAAGKGRNSGKGRRSGKFDRPVEQLFGLYVLAASMGQRAVSVGDEPLRTRPAR